MAALPPREWAGHGKRVAATGGHTSPRQLLQCNAGRALLRDASLRFITRAGHAKAARRRIVLDRGRMCLEAARRLRSGRARSDRDGRIQIAAQTSRTASPSSPDEAFRFASPARVELATHALGKRCSIQLSYGDGAGLAQRAGTSSTE